MKSYFEMVKEWHRAAGHPVESKPAIPPVKRRWLRDSLHDEEYKELTSAMGLLSLTEIADGIADLIWVLCGTAAEYGIPLDEVFAEVYRANMTKTIEPVYREDGKVMKGPAYEPPRIAEILKEASR